MHEIRFSRALPAEAERIRREVFIKEQGFNDEFDETDKSCIHAVLFIDGEAAGTARLFTEDGGRSYHIGRMAVLKKHRGSGAGSEIMNAVCKKAAELGAERCELSAQCRARGFYEKVGYAACGEPFDEEGCPHILMTKRTGGR